MLEVRRVDASTTHGGRPKARSSSPSERRSVAPAESSRLSASTGGVQATCRDGSPLVGFSA